MTSSLDRKVREHNLGINKSTRVYLPWKLACFETYNTRSEARKRELYFKSGYGRIFLKKILGISSRE